MRTFTILATLAAITGALAADNRLLFKHADQDGDAFCDAYKTACTNFKPADPTLTLRTATCQPGDFQGLNPRTEAKAFCSFQATDGSTVLFSTEVGQQVGATPA